MKTVLALLIVSAAGLALNQTASAPSDEDQIKQTIRDYIEGFYTGDVQRVKSAFTPELAKRVVGQSKEGKDALKQMTLEQLLKMTENQRTAKTFPVGKRKLEIEIFDIEGKAASAKATAQEWIDYVHLGKIDGKWVIVNVMWR